MIFMPKNNYYRQNRIRRQTSVFFWWPAGDSQNSTKIRGPGCGTLDPNFRGTRFNSRKTDYAFVFLAGGSGTRRRTMACQEIVNKIL